MIVAAPVSHGPNVRRMSFLQLRAQAKVRRPVPTNEVAEVLFPRLTRLLRASACASTGEACCFLRDVVYYGPNDVLGGECFTHGGLTARRWLSMAIENRNT